MTTQIYPLWNETLKALREATGLTQEDWAKNVDIPQSTWQRWELGQARPDEVNREKIVTAFGRNGCFRVYASGVLRGLDITRDSVELMLKTAYENRTQGKQAFEVRWQPSGGVTEQGPIDPLEIFNRLHLPCLLLDCDLRPGRGWRHRGGGVASDIQVSRWDAGTPFVEGAPASTDIDQHIGEVWQEVKLQNPDAFDSSRLFGVRDHTRIHEKLDSEGRSAIRLHLAETNYRIFQGTNNCLNIRPYDEPDRFRDGAEKLALFRHEVSDPRDLKHSRLANPLSVSLVAVTRDAHDNWVTALTYRNRNAVASGKYRYYCSAGGFVTHVDQDLFGSRSDGVPPDPFRTAVREFGEEFLTNRDETKSITEADVTFTALVRDIPSCWEVILVGEVALPVRKEELGGWLLGVDSFFEGEPRRDPRTGRMKGPTVWIPLTPEGLRDFMLDEAEQYKLRGESWHGFGEWLPSGLMAVMMALVRRFPPDHIADALAPVFALGTHLRMTEDLDHSPPRPDLVRRSIQVD